jgi:hypothetical protein
MLRQGLDLLGLGAPFVYAAMTYSLFLYAEKKASAQAKRAISEWLNKPLLPYDKAAVAAAMLEVFDRIFTRPLWGWRAMLRSALFSIVMMLIYFYEKSLLPAYGSLIIESSEHLFGPSSGPMIFALAEVASPIIANIIADYISLFVVRRWLSVAGQKPMFALFTSWVVAALIILLLYWVRDFVMTGSIIYFDGFGPASFRDVWTVITGAFSYSIGMWMGYMASHDYDVNILFVPAVAIHLWLPLFALSVWLVQGTNYLGFAAAKMQWFLKRGQQRPLEAIGFVAAALVFVIALIWRVLV